MYMPRLNRASSNQGSLEALQPRLLLSSVSHHHSTKSTAATPAIAIRVDLAAGASAKVIKRAPKGSKNPVQISAGGGASPYGGITPAQMVGAYLGTSLNFDGVTGDGSGETIALIDAYDDPGFVNTTAANNAFASSDLAMFDKQYNLPNPPSFTKYGVIYSSALHKYVTTTTLPGDDPNGPFYSTGAFDWEVEESLDVEWAHVMAPKANIVLVEASNTSSLFQAVLAAENLGSVNVVSMSFTLDENQIGNESAYDATYFDNATTSGITFLAAAGDYGAYGTNGSSSDSTTVTPQYPAASPDVVAVGGTTLSVTGNNWLSESTWGAGTNSGMQATQNTPGNGGGGGISLYSSIPGYQTALLGSAGDREYPDISLDGNPSTGVPVYDSYDFGSATPWVLGTVGGTSLAAPLLAGLVAVADQGRALRGLLPLNSTGQTGGVDIHSQLYSLAGNTTSYAADLHDITTGNATGPAGTPPNFSPETSFDLASGLGTPVASTLTTDLAYYNTSVGSSSLAINQPAITSLYFKQDANSAFTDVWVNSATPGTGSSTFKFPDAAISSLTYVGTSGNDSFTLDLTAGTSLENAGFTVNVTGNRSAANVLTIAGAETTYNASASVITFGTTTVNFSNLSTINLNTSAGASTLQVNGNASGNDAFTVTSASVLFDSLTFNESNISLVTLNPGTGIDSLSVKSGSVTIASQTPGAGILTRNFSSISIATNASAIFATAAMHGDRMLVETGALSVSGQLDLGGNDMIIHNGNIAAINALLASGYNAGQWNGSGIASAAAHSDTSHLTALGAIQNTVYGGAGQAAFDGTSPLTTDVLIKYTYYGDANLDGKVDGSDYSRIDSAYDSTLTGWYNGDFNYDSKVNGSDYTLIDNAFNSQGNPL
jgi:hypothetical protein